MKNHVYAVEIKGHKNWYAVAVFIKRQEATTCKYSWQHTNPDDLFRVTKYEPITPKETP